MSSELIIFSGTDFVPSLKNNLIVNHSGTTYALCSNGKFPKVTKLDIANGDVTTYTSEPEHPMLRNEKLIGIIGDDCGSSFVVTDSTDYKSDSDRQTLRDNLYLDAKPFDFGTCNYNQFKAKTADEIVGNIKSKLKDGCVFITLDSTTFKYCDNTSFTFENNQIEPRKKSNKTRNDRLSAKGKSIYGPQRR